MTEKLVYPDAQSLARATADHFVTQARRAIQQRGRFSVALAGGSTPKAAYTLLTHPEYSSQLAWQQIHIFWGDERCVPPDHLDSNYRMAWEALLRHVPLPPQNIHRMPGELPPHQAAEAYQVELSGFFAFPASARQHQTFDLVLLGLGPDGHTASLFPGSPALEQTDRWVTAVEHRHPPAPLVDRLTLTLPAINAAAQIVFLVSGAGKAGILAQVLAPPQGEPRLPAQRVQPASGELLWLLDEAACQDLP
ncbi:MAG: 6-phosphogluconolactonase [Chloroflexota bacterium]